MTEKIDTSNKFLVAATRGKIALMMPPREPFSKDDALLLAAWLVAMSDDSEDNTKFNSILSAVQSL